MLAGTLIVIVVLLLAAMALIVVEICTPFFGLLGLMAMAAAGWAVYLAYTIHPLLSLLLGVLVMVGLPVFTIIAIKVLPNTTLGKHLHLGKDKAEPGQGTPESQKLSDLVGRTTAAETVLRPSGTVRVDGQRIVAQAESGMIDKGATVEIIRAMGTHVVVRQK